MCFLLVSQQQMKSQLYSVVQFPRLEITLLSFRKQDSKQKTQSKNSSSVKTAKYRWLLVLLMEPTLQLWLRIMKIKLTTTIENNDKV